MNGDQPQPQVLLWFKVYCGVMAFIYFLFILFGLVFMILGPSDPEVTTAEAIFLGIIMSGVGLVFGAAFAVPFFAPKKKWSWIYSIILIALGMTSCCVLPFAIPLLIFWLKPEVKVLYGVS